MAPFHLPIREDEKFVGYINVITEQAYRWQNIGRFRFSKIEIRAKDLICLQVNAGHLMILWARHIFYNVI